MSKFSDLDPLLSQVNISSTASTAEQEKFWYFSDQIDCIAEHGLTGSNVKYSRISVSDSKIFDPNGTPSEGFQKKFGEMVEDANKGTPTVTAINLNSKHWVAGMLRETANGKLQFIYNDSSGNQIDKQLAEWLRESGKEVEIIDLKTHQQHDNVNCGAYTIENLLAFARQKDAAQIILERNLDIDTIRANHSRIIDEEITGEKNKEKLQPIREEMHKVFRERFDEQNKATCNNPDEARKLAEKIRNSYSALGIPCDLKQDGNNWTVVLPSACAGKEKEIFTMGPKDLAELKKEIDETAEKQQGGKPSGTCKPLDGTLLDSAKPLQASFGGG